MRDHFASSFLRHGTELRAGWLPSAGLSTPEPFFRQTIERVLERAEERFTGMDVLAQRGTERPAVTPVFVFHVSHCGSTLLSNALKAVGKSIVVSEPPVLGPRQLLRRLPVEDRFHDALIRGAVNSFINGEPRKRFAFFKLMNLATLFLPRFRALFPESPFIFLYRDPAQVIVKLLDAVCEPLRASRMPLIRYALGKPESWNPSPARCWADIYEAQCIAAMVTPGVTCVNYRDLTPERTLDLLARAGVGEAFVDKDRLFAAFTRYSKDFSLSGSFSVQSGLHGGDTQSLPGEVYENARAAYRRIEALTCALAT